MILLKSYLKLTTASPSTINLNRPNNTSNIGYQKKNIPHINKVPFSRSFLICRSIIISQIIARNVRHFLSLRNRSLSVFPLTIIRTTRRDVQVYKLLSSALHEQYLDVLHEVLSSRHDQIIRGRGETVLLWNRSQLSCPLVIFFDFVASIGLRFPRLGGSEAVVPTVLLLEIRELDGATGCFFAIVGRRRW